MSLNQRRVAQQIHARSLRVLDVSSVCKSHTCILAFARLARGWGSSACLRGSTCYGGRIFHSSKQSICQSRSPPSEATWRQGTQIVTAISATQLCQQRRELDDLLLHHRA